MPFQLKVLPGNISFELLELDNKNILNLVATGLVDFVLADSVTAACVAAQFDIAYVASQARRKAQAQRAAGGPPAAAI